MNERIARVLVQDIMRGNSKPGTVQFHDDESVYTVTVTVERVFQKTLRESKGLMVSQGGSGSACGCCGGTGRA